jgi:5'-nucleotidase
MTQNKPLALLTNDDGIESSFLLALVEAFSSSFEVVTCAPDGERSWIGHAISRNAKLLPRKIDDYPSLAYALNGTPADCVNLACGNLLPKAPDLVVSGINLGYNVTLPMILSSGTVGAAMEASLLGFRAMATSMALPNDQFETIRESCGKKMDNQVRKSLRHSAEACAQYALDVIAAPVPEGLVVHNLNFPIGYDGEHDPMISFAGSLNLGSFFEKGDEEKAYQLVYHPERLEAAKVEVGSDLWVMREGMPSVSRLDFSEASGKTYLEP